MTETKSISKIIATTGEKVVDLAIKNGQLIFVQDKQRIALDFGNQRKFYNEINVLNTDAERESMAAPIEGCFYFVIDTAVMWYRNKEWIACTSNSDSTVVISTSLPLLGNKSKLYVDTLNHNISVWDENSQKYEIVGERVTAISDEEINKFFKVKEKKYYGRN